MKFQNLAEELSMAGFEFYRRGWVMGTSGNFFGGRRSQAFNALHHIERQRQRRARRNAFLKIDDNAEILQGFGKPSAETMIHLTIYRMMKNVGSILHTHSVWGTILSDVFFETGAIEIEGYEMLKGLAGVKTHEHRELVPIVENSQDYIALRTLSKTFCAKTRNATAFICAATGFTPGEKTSLKRGGTSKFSSFCLKFWDER